MKWWLVLVIGALALVGLWVTLDKAAAGIQRAWARLRLHRAAPLFEDEERSELEPDIHCDHCTDGCVRCDPRKQDEFRWLPPERTWEQITHHQLPVVRMSPEERKHWRRLDRARERRWVKVEAGHRAAYDALGFDYPSGLMARVRELTP